MSTRRHCCVPRSPHKPPPATAMTAALTELTALLTAEWRTLRSGSGGTSSGSGTSRRARRRASKSPAVAAADRARLLVRRIEQLAIAEASAADALARWCAAPSATEDDRQRLQVFCNLAGHEALCDFVRQCAYGTADAFAPNAPPLLRRVRSGPRDGSNGGGGAECGSSNRGGGAASVSGFSAAGGARTPRTCRAGPSPATGRARAAAVFGAALLLDFGEISGGERGTAIGRGQASDDDDGGGTGGGGGGAQGLRFARLLPAGHLLTVTAQEVRRRREFESALAAVREADNAAKKAEQEQVPKQPQPPPQQQQQQQQQLPQRQLQHVFRDTAFTAGAFSSGEGAQRAAAGKRWGALDDGVLLAEPPGDGCHRHSDIALLDPQTDNSRE